MKTTGKILFFNVNEGKGILITSQKQKVKFSIEEWDDFDVMPVLGLEVLFDLQEGTALNIISKESEEKEENETEESSSVETAASVAAEEVPDDVAVFPEEGAEHSEETEESLEEEELDSYEQDLENSDVFGDEAEKQDALYDEQEAALERRTSHGDKEELPDDVAVFEDDEEDEEYEESEDPLGVIEELLEEELEEREESITLSFNLQAAVENYFSNIQKHINKRVAYKNLKGRLDYLLARRFIWTTFNNLSEIDLHIITPKIKMLSDDLKIMSRVHDDYILKTKHPSLAFAEVFLACQAEYNKIKEGAEKILEKLNLLKHNEKLIGRNLRVKQEELDKNIKSKEFDLLRKDFKSLNGAYVDVVHMMAELDERYKHDLELLHKFEEEYRHDFYDIFAVESKKYGADIIEILSAQAYIVDTQLWHEAKLSKSVKAYFKKSAIEGELNTKTYLKYYLDSLDSTKVTPESKRLYDLYDYLLSRQKEYILLVLTSSQDAMEYEVAIKQSMKNAYVKSFLDEKTAIKWAMKNSVKVVLLEDMLQNTNAAKFLEVYHNNILIKPKIILMGSKPKLNSNLYTISKLLFKGSTPRVVAEAVKSVIEN